MSVSDLLGLEWIFKRVLRPLDMPEEEAKAALAATAEVTAAVRITTQVLDANPLALGDAADVWPGPERVRAWADVLHSADRSGVLLRGSGRARLRRLRDGTMIFGPRLALAASCTGTQEERTRRAGQVETWRELVVDAALPDRDGPAARLRRIDERMSVSGTDRAPGPGEGPPATPEQVAATSRKVQQDLVVLGWLADQVDRQIRRARRWRPDRAG
jgi:hypothetical protein